MLPAFAGVGKSSRVTVIVEVLGAHTPLLIVHSKLFGPTARELTVGLLTVELFSKAVPFKTVQLPLPTEAAVAFNVVVNPQTE